MEGVGKRVRQLRLESESTQKDIAARSGLTVSYLSRLENDRITPSVRTLHKIAGALDVPVSALFDGDPATWTGESCPVSLSGRCILEHRYISAIGRPLDEEAYTSEQLEVLQQCNDLLQHADAEVLTALERIVRSLTLLQGARAKARERATDNVAVVGD